MHLFSSTEHSAMAAAFLLLLLFLSLSTVTISLANDISIDCGSTGSYIDESNRTWVGDDTFIATGSIARLKVADLAQYLATLRYFPTGETNCYSNIPVTKGGKILVRMRFYYGNYDDNIQAPKFDVVYDGKHRDVVSTPYTGAGFSEAIFVPENGNISICFVRTSSSQNPFVSTIEIRDLDMTMYSDLGPAEGFILRQRIAYGSEELVRSPFDPYDRFWLGTGSSSVSTVTSTAVSINTTGLENQPPEIVLRTARSDETLRLYDLGMTVVGVSFYLALYFSEPLSLGSDQKRSFIVYFDDKQVGLGPILPPFGKGMQVVLRGVTVSSSPDLEFKGTPDSTMSPLINALELYVITNVVGGGGGGSNGTGGGGGSGNGTGGGGGSGGGNKGGNNNNNNKDATGGSEGSSGSEEKKTSSAALPLGITLPLFAVGAGGYYAWKYTRRRRDGGSTKPLNQQNVNVSVNVNGRDSKDSAMGP